MYFDRKVAEAYRERWKDYRSGRLDSLREAFVAMLPERGRVLDAGCASGRDVRHLLDLGVEHVYGLDLSPELARLAKKTHPDGSYAVGDVRKLPYRDGVFDGIHCMSVFLHLQPDSIREALSEFYRTLKRGGVVYLSTVADERFHTRTSTSFGVERAIFYYTEASLLEMIREAGFDIRQVLRQANDPDSNKPGYYANFFMRKPD